MELNHINNFVIAKSGYIDISQIMAENFIKLKQYYVKFITDCIFDDKLEDVITFKQYCEDIDLEERQKWESGIQSSIEIYKNL